MSEVLLFAILAVLVCFVFWLLIGPPPHLTGRRRDGQSNLYHRTIPYCEAVSPPNLPDGWQAVIPHGGEVFFPKSPTRTYQIEIRGVCRFRAAREIFPADALYYAKHGRFLDRHFQLSINGKSFFRTSELRVVDEDRGNHAYQFIYQGDSVALAFGMAYESCVHPDNGYLEARVTPLPDAKAERAREERRKEAEAQAATFSQAVKAVVNYAQLNPNWGNAEYRQRFAEVHHAELIQSQAEIRNNARGFLEKDQLIRYLRRHHPEAVEILFGRLDALTRAENVSLTKAIAAAEAKPSAPRAPASPRRKRLNSQQVQELKVRRQQIDLGDTVALAFDRVATEGRVKAHVREQYAQLDEDEQTRIIQRILDQIDERENQNGKGKTL